MKELRNAFRQGVLSERSKPVQFATKFTTKASWIGVLGIAVIWLFSCFAAPDLFAHTLDTSYCKVRITQHEIEFKFTYDLLTLQRIFPLDANHDDRISRTEVEAAVAKIRGFLRDHIYLELNQRDTEFADAQPTIWPEDAGAAIPKSEYAQRLLTFTFKNQVLSAPEDVALTFDFFEQLGAAHTVLGAFDWQGHDDEVIFTRFEPDYLYDTGYCAPVTEELGQYLKLGMKHIFLGCDHIAFLVALLFVKRFVDLLKIITAFTIAHTITLALAVLQIVRLSPHLVEIGIALTIMYVAAENFWARDTRHRWMLTFCFGLVHGFGFASVLRGLGLPSNGLARSLLCFNLGVEASQVAIVAVLWPVLWLVNRQPWASSARLLTSIGIFVLGAAWFLQRTFGLRLLPL
ncbi:MAG TPA: HupE/UreJ family protein [Candidatus Dormibacteraeota bacterium]|nr:HupE/UreJ family protein [Candidatus Dormibacteraeota bacterium]